MSRQQRRRQQRKRKQPTGRGPGAARRYKERQLGLQIEGFSKPMLDAMNVQSKQLFHLGVGVLVQEEERARRIYGSVVEERRRVHWLFVARKLRYRAAERRAQADLELWSGRLRTVAAAVSAEHATSGVVTNGEGR